MPSGFTSMIVVLLVHQIRSTLTRYYLVRVDEADKAMEEISILRAEIGVSV